MTVPDILGILYLISIFSYSRYFDRAKCIEKEGKTVYCRTCGHQLNDNADVCMNCGCRPQKGRKYCQNCGAETSEAQDVCIKCGVKLNNGDILGGFSGGTRQKLVAALLAFFLGTLGIHDFYLGFKGRGIIKIILTITCYGAIISEIWALIDFIQILTGSKRDAAGHELI